MNMFLHSSLIGLLNLDTTSFLQSSISRPVFVSFICGWILGYPLEAFVVGVMVEFLMMDFPPIGGMPVPNGCVGVGIGVYLIEYGGCGFAFLAAIASGVLYSYVEKALRHYRLYFNRFIERSIMSYRFSFTRWVMLSVFIEFIIATIYVWIFIMLLGYILRNIPFDISFFIKGWLNIFLICVAFVMLSSFFFKFLTQVKKNA